MNEMREALARSHGCPVEVEDEQAAAVYVLIDKNTFAHIQDSQGRADEETRRHLKALIGEGIASGEYRPGEKVFANLRQYVSGLTSK